MRIATNGCGVAGPAPAWWLREFGFEPVLFEAAPALRTGEAEYFHFGRVSQFVWVSGGNIEDYMGRHQHDADARELWAHFESVIEWVKATFPAERPNLMRDVDWGSVYDIHCADTLDPDRLEAEIHQLLSLEEPGVKGAIRKPSGVYLYVLDGDERHLNLRSFSKAQKVAAYERQDGICADCGQAFGYGQMEGDHIKPWKEGGLTTDDNLQMLCKPCNPKKGRDMNDQEDKPKRGRGRPVEKPMPDLIPDTPENIMRALLNAPPKREDEGRYLQEEAD